VYLCETNLRLIQHFRGNFGRLANALIMENKKDSAIMALDRAYEVIPTYQLPLGYFDLTLLEQYYRAGAKEKGSALAEAMFKTFSEELDYYLSFPSQFSAGIRSEFQNRKTVLLFMCEILHRYDRNLFDTYKIHWDALFPYEPLDRYFQPGIMEELFE